VYLDIEISQVVLVRYGANSWNTIKGNVSTHGFGYEWVAMIRKKLTVQP
jgi:hypothetical protein